VGRGVGRGVGFRRGGLVGLVDTMVGGGGDGTMVGWGALVEKLLRVAIKPLVKIGGGEHTEK